jgi:outer membrane protein TolC
LRAASERIEVTKTAGAEAEEALRIAQNRYDAGMGNIADVLRLEAAVSDTRTRKLQAIHDQRIAATMLELVSGELAPGSGVLNQ